MCGQCFLDIKWLYNCADVMAQRLNNNNNQTNPGSKERIKFPRRPYTQNVEVLVQMFADSYFIQTLA